MAASMLLTHLRPRQNGRHFADDPFKSTFLNATLRIAIKISLNFVPKVPINNIPALVQIMAWHRPGDKPLSEPLMARLSTHICVTRPQWVNTHKDVKFHEILLTILNWTIWSKMIDKKIDNSWKDRNKIFQLFYNQHCACFFRLCNQDWSCWLLSISRG